MCDSFTASKDNWKQAKTNCDEKEVALKMSGKKRQSNCDSYFDFI